MWSSRLFWKLFVVCVGLNLILAVGYLIVVTSSQEKNIKEQVEQRLYDSAVVLRSHVRKDVESIINQPKEASKARRAKLQNLIQSLSRETETRITIVEHNGDVLADSDRQPETMLNHANRPELIDAGKSGIGTDTRTSPTLNIDLYYLALPLEPDSDESAFVRVAMKMDAIHQRVAAVRRFLWMFALAIGAAAVALTYTVVGRIIHPLSQLTRRAKAIASGRKDDPVIIDSKDEVGVLASAFNQMQLESQKRFHQLQENNEQMATVLASMDEGIIAVDAEENLLLANNASRRQLNFASDDEIGQPLLAAVRCRPLHEAISHCLRTGGAIQTEFASLGQPRLDLAVHATCLPGDPPPGVVVVLHDITELRRLENLRREFVANVSHELKTPLAAIKAYSETLRLGAISDPQNNLGFVRRIEEQAERLHQLILDMLQIARMESGQEVFDITEVELNDMILNCVSIYADAAQRKRIELAANRPSDPIVVRADEEGLRTILGNLIDNAIKYTPEKGNVSVTWWAEEGHVMIEVEDTGIGITAHDQTRVFERFYRADKARSRELGGTGLGLSIVKHLVQSFGGSVELRSQLGTGSCFQIRLPLVLPAPVIRT